MPKKALSSWGNAYLAALNAALDRDAEPASRASAGRIMRELVDGVPRERGPHSAQRTHSEERFLRGSVPLALDHRICGES